MCCSACATVRASSTPSPCHKPQAGRLARPRPGAAHDRIHLLHGDCYLGGRSLRWMLLAATTPYGQQARPRPGTHSAAHTDSRPSSRQLFPPASCVFDLTPRRSRGCSPTSRGTPARRPRSAGGQRQLLGGQGPQVRVHREGVRDMYTRCTHDVLYTRCVHLPAPFPAWALL